MKTQRDCGPEKPEERKRCTTRKWEQANNPTCSHRQAVDTAQHTRKHGRTAPPGANLSVTAQEETHVKKISFCSLQPGNPRLPTFFSLCEAPPTWQKSGSQSAHTTTLGGHAQCWPRVLGQKKRVTSFYAGSSSATASLPCCFPFGLRDLHLHTLARQVSPIPLPRRPCGWPDKMIRRLTLSIASNHEVFLRCCFLAGRCSHV